ncbi:MAG: histidine phosphatase family protein [Methylophaga sp.]|uniref:histidine phosphatase family protein n=1 Tax=Methylophaga sp. TaxID=2024840 RepID=UPI00299EBDF4|nr:histidine phosphatase family protein [Methylophaga sp.]MDX1749809.1 histidine phosphatase family protein [Methylophaga sp.]
MALVIDLMRHGEPQGGMRYRGQLDDPLSELGWQQMRSATENKQPWQKIVSSTLIRCADFAKELAEKHAISLQCDAAFIEIGFGDWEGKTASELEQQNKKAFYAFYDDPIKNTPANAESLLAFQRRIQKAWQTLVQSHNDKHILLVAHAGVIRVILAEVLAMPLEAMFRIQVPYAAISRVVIHNEGPRLYPQLQFHAGIL